MAHSTSSPASIFSSELSPSMSFPRGPRAGGEGVLEKRGPGHPKGSRKRAAMPATTPLASHKRGRPKGSRNQKTLVALAAIAAPAPTIAAAIGVAPVLGGEGAPMKQGPGRPKGSGKGAAPMAAAAPSLSRHRGQPPGSKNKKLLLPLGPLPLGPRGPARRPLHRLVHLGFNRCCRRSSRRPTPRPKGGPPS
jgi:hypothetical protein